ncbi:unnamed protein product [Rhodiola kirilowii]
MGAYELVDGEESRKIGNVREELERMEEGLVEGGKSLSLGIAAGLKECDGGGGGGRGKKERLASLDVFRGLTVVLMIIVDPSWRSLSFDKSFSVEWSDFG